MGWGAKVDCSLRIDDFQSVICFVLRVRVVSPIAAVRVPPGMADGGLAP